MSSINKTSVVAVDGSSNNNTKRNGTKRHIKKMTHRENSVFILFLAKPS